MSENQWRSTLTIKLISEPLAKFTSKDSVKKSLQKIRKEGWSEAVFDDESDDYRFTTFTPESLADASTWNEVTKTEVKSNQIVSQDCSIRASLKRIISKERLYVLSDSGLTHIVTVADLNKQAAQLMTFGIIQDLETKLLNSIKHSLGSEDAIEALLNEIPNPFRQAFKLQSLRKTRGQELNLSDCLDLTQKTELARRAGLKHITRLFGDSNSQIEKTLEPIQDLRNNLAHGQCAGDLTGGWSVALNTISLIEQIIIDLAEQCDKA